MTFHKPPLSVKDQIKLLAHRGMVIPDHSLATHYLTHINYYRLRAYWLPYELIGQSGEHQFLAGTQFSDVIAIYQFDSHIAIRRTKGD